MLDRHDARTGVVVSAMGGMTDALLRLPAGDPFLTSIEDPILRMCYLGLLILFLVGVTLQLRWIHRQPA